MGFKAKARKHMSNDSKKEDAKSKKSNQGELSCAIKGCDKFADKSLKGRSLSLDNAIEMWVKVPLLVPKVESVCARVATELGRKKIKPMITTDSLSVFFRGVEKLILPKAKIVTLCAVEW